MSMRVLVVTNMWPTAEAPLRGTFVHEQVASLRQASAQLHIEVLVVEGQRSRLEYARAVVRLRQALRSGFDLVHAHYGLTAAVAATQARCPVVATFHGSDLYIPWQRAVSRLAMARIRQPIFVSERLRRRSGTQRGEVIPCGVDTRLFRPLERAEARRELGWRQDRNVVLFPGDPGNPAKNHALFEATLSRLPASLAARTDGVALTGIARERVPLHLAAADAVLVTSRYEGACNVAKEALACARPVVSVPVGDIPELIEGVAGCEVRPHDADALAQALAATLESGGGGTGPDRIRSTGVDLRSVARRVLAVYERVLS